MKHLPNELLYLLKVYNYITYDIGLDFARGRAEEIRDYIAKADSLNDYPTVREYLSPKKSIDDIITYIKRNEKTYSLLSEWKDGEITSHFKNKGLDGSFGFAGSFDLLSDAEGNIYFTLPYKPCIEHKITLIGADSLTPVHVEKILWFEFYKSKESFAIEIFDDNCETVKVTFSDFEIGKIFLSGAPLAENCKSSFEAVSKLSSFICEKHGYKASLLSEKETALLSTARFFANQCTPNDTSDPCAPISLLSEYKLEKAIKIINSMTSASSEKKKLSLSKKLFRFLKSKKCIPLLEKVLYDLLDSQKNQDTI